MPTLTCSRLMNKPLRNTLAILIVLFAFAGCDSQQQSADGQEAAPQISAEDPASTQRLAKSCLQCHPINTAINNSVSPHITGQPAAYLAKAMRDYLSGAREHQGMGNAVRLLKDAELDALAVYYSEQPAAWLSMPSPVEHGRTMDRDEAIAAGRVLAAPCFSCHGDEGNSTREGVPSLAGLSSTSFTNAINDYFQGQRQSKVMSVFKHTIDAEKIARLAAYFSSRSRILTDLPTQGNTATGESLANRYCAGCHGGEGNSVLEEYPSLAGQNYQYMVAATSAYQDGTRHSDLMQEAVEALSGDDIVNLSTYYATRKYRVQKLAPVSPDALPMVLAADSARMCVGCHGHDGHSSIKGTPHLSGLSQEYLAEAINQYKNGQRTHGLMKLLAGQLSEIDVELVSLYFAGQTPRSSISQGKKSKVAQSIISACEACHGEQGNSPSANVPSLAGQDVDYLVETMSQYKNKQRPNSEMRNAVEKVARSDFKPVATYFASQAPRRPEFRVPETSQQLAEKCNRCHDENGGGGGDDLLIPRIAGQQQAYLFKVLGHYKAQDRKHSGMHAMADGLSHWEMHSIAKYYARMPATGQ